MKLVGIDYGSKRIGMAVSDEAQSFAFPESIVQNNEYAADDVRTFCEVHGTKTVIMGESKNFKGNDNAIMDDVRAFVEKLKAEGLEVIFEPEVMSTMQAERFQGKRDDIDASAAAVILQSYLDRQKHSRSAAEQVEKDAKDGKGDDDSGASDQGMRFDVASSHDDDTQNGKDN